MGSAEPNQIRQPDEGAKIPALTVLKKGTVLKNIFLNAPPPGPWSGEEEDEGGAGDGAAKFLVGRHPDCHVVLDHPSVSRFHLEVRVIPASQRLYVKDLSSVHGTWVSGKKIEPRVPVKLEEGDALKLGASTRVYVLRWVSRSGIFELENPLESLMEEKEEIHHDENCESFVHNLNNLWVSEIPSAPPMPGSIISALDSQITEWEEPRNVNSPRLPLSPKNEYLSQSRSEKRLMSSCLLSRRSKSINFLCIPNGKSAAEKIGVVMYSVAKPEVEILKEYTTDVVFRKSEESVCRALFADDDEEEDVHYSDKENMNPAADVTQRIRANRELHKSCLNVAVHLKEEEEETSYSGMGNCVGDLFNYANLNQGLEAGRAFGGNDVRTKTKEDEVAHSKCEKKTSLDGGVQEFRVGEILDEDDIRFETKEDELFDSDKENQMPEFLEESQGIENMSANCLKFEREIMKRKTGIPFQVLLETPISRTASPVSNAKSPYDGCSEVSEKCSIYNSDIKRIAEIAPFQGLKEKYSRSTQSSRSTNEPYCSSGNLKFKGAKSENHSRTRKDVVKKSTERIPFQTLSSNIQSPGRDVVKRSIERIPFQTLGGNIESPSSHAISKKSLEKESISEDYSRVDIGAANSMGGSEFFSFQQFPLDSFKERKPSFADRICGNSLIQSREEVLQSGGRRKKWNMVADASCFLNDESRKALQLMEGICGTHLIIPTMVIRELDYLKRHEGLFRKTTKASLVLRWIEECMIKSSWWIHVQSSGEMLSVARTPPATPRTEEPNDGGKELRACSNCTALSTHSSLAEIVSPTAEDHILDCALLSKRLKHEEQVILLTDSVCLRIKAMAEGLLCETVKEFRESLVNPYSERFMWMESSPRGATWSLSGEVEFIEKHYSGQPYMRKSTKVAVSAAKGLKLILFQNAHYGQLAAAR